MPHRGPHLRREVPVKAWYLVTTKLKNELRVKQNLYSQHRLESFFPVYPPKKKGSPVGLPLFARYIFVKCDIGHDHQKVKYTPGVTRIVAFGESIVPVPDEVIDCLKARCDAQDRVLPPSLAAGQKVRVTGGVFEGCEGIIREKRGARRIQLLHKLAFGQERKIEVGISDVEPAPD